MCYFHISECNKVFVILIYLKAYSFDPLIRMKVHPFLFSYGLVIHLFVCYAHALCYFHFSEGILFCAIFICPKVLSVVLFSLVQEFFSCYLLMSNDAP